MSRISLRSSDQGLVAAFRTKARGLDFTFTLQSDGEGDPRSERPAALVVDLRSESEIPETALRAAECLLLVICTDEDAGLAERAMRDHEAHVVFADSTERAALQGVFALRKALYEDDKHGTALEAARTAATRYEDLLQATPDIVYRLDAEGNFTFVNDAIRSLGYVPEDLIGRHFSKILHEEDIARVSRRYVLPHYRGKLTGKDGAPGLFDERRGRERRTRGMEIRLKGGPRAGAPESMEGVAVTYGEVSATGHYREEKRKKIFTGTVGIIRDVSWRKRSEKLLHLASRALEQSNTGVCIFSPDGEIEYANPRYSRMLGVPHDRLLGSVMNEVWKRHCPDTELEELVRTAVEVGNVQRDLRCVTEDNGDIWVSARAQIVETGDGLTYILLLQDDIGERKVQEEKLRRALDEKSVLLQEVHHRVKNNLQVIASMLSIEAGQHGDRQVREFLATSQGRIRAMALVHDALHHSDTQARLDLPSYLNQVIDGVVQTAGRTVDLQRALPDAYHVDLSFAILFGLLVNELIGYVLNDGDENTATLQLKVDLELGEKIVLRVSGGGRETTPDAGAGILIIQALVGQLEGEITFTEEGDAELTTPLP